MRSSRLALGALLLLNALPLAAQDGAGTAGATVLQLMAGSRAPALSGAYAGIAGDADALFYNPAGAATLRAAGMLSYQRHVEDIGLISAAGAFRTGPVVLGASLVVLDYGSIDEIVPDDGFGGETGLPTGATVSASELAARFTAALPLAGDRMRLGVSAGVVSTDLAGTRRSAPFLDAGMQYSLPRLTLGASLRSLGGALAGRDMADAPLPSELRAGAALDLAPSAGGFGVLVSADFVAGLEEGSTGLLAGIEAGLRPTATADYGAVMRAGWNAGIGSDGLGALQVGGGLNIGEVAVDYTWQRYDFFGTIHRFGVRWARSR